MIYQFTIALQDMEPPIWRRFQVDSSITFHQLHETIQIIMGWENYHMYMFSLGDKLFTLPNPEFASANRNELNAKKEKLTPHIRLEGQRLEYMYDMGDSWQHELVLEKILAPEGGKLYPISLAGDRACPPEDCGGVFGYQHMLQVLADPKHPEYEYLAEWMGGGLNPDKFDIAKVNKLLQRKAKQLNPKSPQKNTANQKLTNSRKAVTLTPAKLKQQLNSLTQPELIQLVTECFKASKEAEQFLTVKLLGDEKNGLR